MIWLGIWLLETEYDSIETLREFGNSPARFLKIKRGALVGIYGLERRDWIFPVSMDSVDLKNKWEMFEASRTGVTQFYTLDGNVIPETDHIDTVHNDWQSFTLHKEEFIALERPDHLWTVYHRSANSLLDQTFTSVIREPSTIGALFHFKTISGEEFTLDQGLEVRTHQD